MIEVLLTLVIAYIGTILIRMKYVNLQEVE
nr:MAG TPA: hypothetical protein [Crassvirales sp.]DAP79171.1 MAG TPA: hypothetical protein [Caudoviricetes sp.]